MLPLPAPVAVKAVVTVVTVESAEAVAAVVTVAVAESAAKRDFVIMRNASSDSEGAFFSHLPFRECPLVLNNATPVILSAAKNLPFVAE